MRKSKKKDVLKNNKKDNLIHGFTRLVDFGDASIKNRSVLRASPKFTTGFTCGAFDLLHAGHILMLKEVCEQCDFLIVGLHTDPTIDRPEKNKPIESVEERIIRLEGCKYVDQIITYDTEEDLYQLLKKLKPDVRFMGKDWENKPNYSRDKLPEIKVVYNSRDHNYSSTNLRERILKNQKNF